jgi:hypothetical protein
MDMPGRVPIQKIRVSPDAHAAGYKPGLPGVFAAFSQRQAQKNRAQGPVDGFYTCSGLAPTLF